ncbi:MAG: NUDIX hydrolase [Microgenomates group bacterium]|jgi:8-oxo-dGTP diphosphatase|nr:NUDIX hydrolase [Microgenomates group bacterium]
MLDKYYIILAVAAFIVNPKNELLIIKKSPYEMIDAGLWTVPGGKVRSNEPIIDCLKREIKEEVGLTIVSYQWIGEDVFDYNGEYFHGEHFFCPMKKINKIVLEKNLVDFRWLKKTEINQFQFHPNIKKEIYNIFKNFV